MTDAPTTSLRRTEAVARAALLRVRHTRIELDLTGPGDLFVSTTTLTVDCTHPGERTFLDFAGAELVTATVDGVPFDPAWDGRRIQLPPLPATATITIGGRMRYSSDGEGLHRHVDPADQRTYLYAMSFLDAGPRWFACFDQPDLKSPYELLVDAPEGWTVAGNGPAEGLGAGRWRIVQPRPLSSYVVTLVAGPYATVTGEHDGIPLALHAPASLTAELHDQAADILQVTAQSFDYYHRTFGVRYPFGEYHQAFVPDFNAGAMENPGCITIRSEFLPRGRSTTAEAASRAGVIAHEMAHQWFGDLVTMRWWDDLWLNESFAEYLAHRVCAEATRYDLWTEFGIVRKDWGFVADTSPSTHPVAGNGAAEAASALADFDGISYAKGAALLKQLAGLIGDEVFFAGLADYFGRYAFGNAELAELMACWTRAGAVGLDEWARGWLQAAGLDTLVLQPAGPGVGLTRLPSATHPAERTHAVTLAALDERGAELFRVPAVVVTSTEPWEPPVGTALILPDADDDAWADLRWADGWDEVLRLAPAIQHPPSRVAVINAIRSGVREADLDPAAALTTLLDVVRTEEAEVTIERLLTFAQDVVAEQCTAGGVQAARRAQVRATAGALLDAAAAGSDRQLIAFRAAVRSEDDPGRLRAWYDGDLPVGVAPDAELHWRLVTRYAERGGDPALIELTLAADPSSSGRVHATRARAARPDPAAKEAAWRAVAEPSSAGAYEVYASAEGLFRAGQTELTAPYVDRYVAAIGATARFRSGWVLGEVARRAFPGSHVDPATLAAVQALAAEPGLAQPVRRAVVDRTDRLRRSLASRRRYPESAL